VTFAFDASAPAGSRVSEVMVGGVPLEADKVYTVAVNDFILGGGDGYDALGGGRIVTEGATGQLLANQVMAYVEKLGSVNVGVEGRIRKLGQ
jgi:2',3'-cyclic-nucleotide 2'-phosphodiesterase (5'-nucleotidase family)